MSRGRRIAVHPHARGERVRARRPHREAGGSSPRPWGTPLPFPSGPCCERFIPTPVGNACNLLLRRTESAVHPHARGERHASRTHSRSPGGSSPRPWGTPCQGWSGCRRRRFIPTPVGNAAAALKEVAIRTVHPHARGERSGNDRCIKSLDGSSPRPWGTHVKRIANAKRKRFIPTPVGNATKPVVAPRPAAVHPHARGERLERTHRPGHCDGSSPRPWGTPDAHARQACWGRFIPTPVGNAGLLPALKAGQAVHPHARGERAHPMIIDRCVSGSSPRPWGTRPAATAASNR